MKLPDYFKVSTNRKGTKVNIEPIYDTDLVEVVRCMNCKHREKYTYHCSVLNRDILLTDYCSMAIFEERKDVPDCRTYTRGKTE